MSQNREGLVVPVFVIAIGVSWLLNALGVMPQVDWLWPIGLAVAGVLTLYVGKLDKLTFTVGPTLLVASVTSFLRETGRLKLDLELPILTIVLGSLMLLGRFLKLRTPAAFQDEPKSKN